MDVQVKSPRLALVGNPNSGKTALFNALTGGKQKVANYPGVTVERKEGFVGTPAGLRVSVLDLPGTYSLRARSLDEAITRDAVLGKLAGEAAPDIIVCVADASNLRLVLRLVLELKQVGRPCLLALNMFDIAERHGVSIDIDGLSRDLAMPVVTTVAVRKRGLDKLLEEVDKIAFGRVSVANATWAEPNAAELRAAHREAERILKAHVRKATRPDTATDKIDNVLLHPVWGVAILLVILFLMFQAVFTWSTPPMDAIDAGFTWLQGVVAASLPEGLLRSFIADGLIAGVGNVVKFLPQILVLFAFIITLEDFGYMARAAFLMDKLMGVTGLHGRSFIPLLSSFACAIPGIMAARVIDNRRDRLATILIAPLITCSARLPVYTLIIGAFVPSAKIGGVVSLQGLVMFGLFAAGIVSALGVAFVMRRFFWRGLTEPFLLELPAYKTPNLSNIVSGVLERGRIFLRRAGTIILSMAVAVWVLCTFPYAPSGASEPAINYSFAGMLGHAIEPLFAPIGFSWQMTVALIPGMAAREVAVSALGSIYAISGGDAELGANLSHHWSLASALAFLAWYVFAPQCVSTLGVIKRETNSWKWPAITFGYMLALAYIAAFVVYSIASSM